MTSTEPSHSSMNALNWRLAKRHNLNCDLLSLQRGALDAYCQGAVTAKELQSVLSISYLQYVSDTELKLYFATPEKKCPNT